MRSVFALLGLIMSVILPFSYSPYPRGGGSHAPHGSRGGVMKEVPLHRQANETIQLFFNYKREWTADGPSNVNHSHNFELVWFNDSSFSLLLVWMQCTPHRNSFSKEQRNKIEMLHFRWKIIFLACIKKNFNAISYSWQRQFLWNVHNNKPAPVKLSYRSNSETERLCFKYNISKCNIAEHSQFCYPNSVSHSENGPHAALGKQAPAIFLCYKAHNDSLHSFLRPSNAAHALFTTTPSSSSLSHSQLKSTADTLACQISLFISQGYVFMPDT